MSSEAGDTFGKLERLQTRCRDLWATVRSLGVTGTGAIGGFEQRRDLLQRFSQDPCGCHMQSGL